MFLSLTALLKINRNIVFLPTNVSENCELIASVFLPAFELA
jgi:hypothetical protein